MQPAAIIWGVQALGDEGLLIFGELDPGHERVIGLVGHFAAVDDGQRVADQLFAGVRVHKDVVECEVAVDDLEERDIGQRAGPQGADLLLQSHHGRGPFGRGVDDPRKNSCRGIGICSGQVGMSNMGPLTLIWWMSEEMTSGR